MSDTALTPIVDGRIWALDRPIWFSGIRMRARTTVVRLEDGALLLHSPGPPSSALVAELRALGPVRWLLAPNVFHHLGLPDAAAAFPDAQIVGPRSVLAKNDALRIDLPIDDARVWDELPEIEALPLAGVPFLDEMVLFHRPTRTLIGADVAICATPADHFTTRWAGRLFGFYETLRVPPDVKRKIPDKAAAARSLRAMLDLPAGRLIVAHADVIEAGCLDQLAAAWRREGVDV